MHAFFIMDLPVFGSPNTNNDGSLQFPRELSPVGFKRSLVGRGPRTMFSIANRFLGLRETNGDESSSSAAALAAIFREITSALRSFVESACLALPVCQRTALPFADEGSVAFCDAFARLEARTSSDAGEPRGVLGSGGVTLL